MADLLPSVPETKVQEAPVVKVPANFENHNSFVQPLLTDLYEITMVYSFWKQKKHNQPCTFDLFFRKHPFKGEYTVFCGLEDCLRFIHNYKFSKGELEFLKQSKPEWEEDFWAFLAKVDCSNVIVYAQKEGSIVYPRMPLLRVEGPLAICQLIETTLLNLVNYPSLIATNAARHRVAVGPKKILLEFGLRRAQGPDGGMSASRYSYIGGYNGTSNVQAARIFDIPVKGTHAHSYVSSFQSLDEVANPMVAPVTGGPKQNLVEMVKTFCKEMDMVNTNEGELAAFCAYASDYPSGFLALIDTYSTYYSGMLNFSAVALALIKLGYKPIGIRLDSGDLAQQSIDIYNYFQKVGKKYTWAQANFEKMGIIASNDLHEEALIELQSSKVSGYGVGTNLVTCKSQPALGCVYKLVAINGKPRIKVSQELKKMSMPGKKEAYRLYNKNGDQICDLMCLSDEPVPATGKPFTCRDPFSMTKRVMVEAARVEPLLEPVWVNGRLTCEIPTIHNLRKRLLEHLETVPQGQLKYQNPDKFKVLVSTTLFDTIQTLWNDAWTPPADSTKAFGVDEIKNSINLE